MRASGEPGTAGAGEAAAAHSTAAKAAAAHSAAAAAATPRVRGVDRDRQNKCRCDDYRACVFECQH
jgi:hypothetical protein